MPEIYFKEDFKDEDGNVVFHAGTFRTIFPGSDLLKRVIESGVAETTDYLPLGFPGLKHLLEVGIDSYQKLKGVNVRDIKGIGEKTATEIEELSKQTKK